MSRSGWRWWYWGIVVGAVACDYVTSGWRWLSRPIRVRWWHWALSSTVLFATVVLSEWSR